MPRVALQDLVGASSASTAGSMKQHFESDSESGSGGGGGGGSDRDGGRRNAHKAYTAKSSASCERIAVATRFCLDG